MREAEGPGQQVPAWAPHCRLQVYALAGSLSWCGPRQLLLGSAWFPRTIGRARVWAPGPRMSWVNHVSIRDVVQPPGPRAVFVAAALQVTENKKFLLSPGHSSARRSRRNILYNPAKHKICASPITRRRNAGPRRLHRHSQWRSLSSLRVRPLTRIWTLIWHWSRDHRVRPGLIRRLVKPRRRRPRQFKSADKPKLPAGPAAWVSQSLW